MEAADIGEDDAREEGMGEGFTKEGEASEYDVDTDKGAVDACEDDAKEGFLHESVLERFL